MKIGLVSDVHASPAPLRAAIEIFHRHHVERIICAGDIAGYNDELDETIDLLIDNEIECIIGNHDQSYLANHHEQNRTTDFLSHLPETIIDEIEGCSFYIVHAEPPDRQHDGIKLLDVECELIPERLRSWEEKLTDFGYDILIVGHTHQVYALDIADTLVINPGSAPYNNSCMILDLPSRVVATFNLDEQPVKPVWNWGMQVRD